MAAFTIIFAAVYLLYMVQNIIMGDVTDFLKGLGDKLTDVNRDRSRHARAAGAC